MGCKGKKSGKGGGKIVLGILVAGLMAGCSTSDLAKIEDPLVINQIAVGSYQGCCEAAKKKPTDAAIALRVLNGLGPQIEACRAGLTDCMPDPNGM